MRCILVAGATGSLAEMALAAFCLRRSHHALNYWGFLRALVEDLAVCQLGPRAFRPCDSTALLTPLHLASQARMPNRANRNQAGGNRRPPTGMPQASQKDDKQTQRINRAGCPSIRCGADGKTSQPRELRFAQGF